MTLVWAPGYNGITDPDAQTYLAAVEAADGQAIEGDVALAINDFVVGCKLDGIWDAIKASCILAGARTLDGALVPLKGTAPTNFNFVAADYNRETGLKGNGSTKYLNSNRNNNADPQGSNHNAVWVSNYTSGDQYVIGDVGESGFNGSNFVLLRTTEVFFRNRYNGNDPVYSATSSQYNNGLFAASRTSTTTVDTVHKQSTGSIYNSASRTSTSPSAFNISVFRAYGLSSSCRLSFYSIGESIDLEKLDTRTTRLMNLITYSFTAGLPDLSTMDLDAASYIGAVYRAGGTLS